MHSYRPRKDESFRQRHPKLFPFIQFVQSWSLCFCQGQRMEADIRFRFIDATLVVCSSSIMLQWEKTLKMPKGRIRLIKLNTKKDIQNFAETLDRNRNTKKEIVFLCGHTLYNFLARVCFGLVWKRFVFDEPASVKIPSMEPWSACFRGWSQLHITCFMTTTTL